MPQRTGAGVARASGPTRGGIVAVALPTEVDQRKGATRGGGGAPCAGPEPRAARHRLGTAAALALYLALAVALTERIWTGGPASRLVASGADPGQEVWFLGWVAHALASGENPLFSPALFVPHGVNLAVNTSFPLLGALLAPVTLLLGPVVALDLAVTLAPVATAASTFVVARRVTGRAAPAALGGLVAGFSPALLTDLGQAHLNLTMLPLLPLLAGLGARLAARPDHPVRDGAALGILVAAQGLVGPELLADLALCGAVTAGVAVLLWHEEARRRWRALVLAAATTAVVAACLLAYPVWFAFEGPAHLDGPIRVVPVGESLRALVVPGWAPSIVGELQHYGYLGAPVLVLLGWGLSRWRQDRALVATAVALLTSIVASLGTRLAVGVRSTDIPLPAALLGHLPVLGDVTPFRFSLLSSLFAGLGIAIVLGRLLGGTPPSPPVPAVRADPADSPASLRTRRVAAAAAAALVVANLVLADHAPLPVGRVAPPLALARPAALSLPPGAVVLEYPEPASTFSEGMVWQALDNFRYRLVGGYAWEPGPGHAASWDRFGSAWSLAIAAVELGDPLDHLSRPQAEVLRLELRRDGVAAVVAAPGQAHADAFVRLVEQVLGRPPASVDGARVWLLDSGPPQARTDSTGSGHSPGG